MRKFSILLFIFTLMFFSCKENTKAHKGKESPKAKSEQTVKTKKQGKIFRLPPLPQHIYDDIYKYSDYLDVLFEDLEFSMSQDNNASIRSFLKNINLKRTAALNTACKPMGHVSFIKNGESIIEADFYHEPGCYYFIFNYEGDPPMFSNAMSDVGVQFFNNLKSKSFKVRK